MKPKIGLWGNQNEENSLYYFYYIDGFDDILMNGYFSMDPNLGISYKRKLGNGAVRVEFYGKTYKTTAQTENSNAVLADDEFTYIENIIVPSLGYEYQKFFDKSCFYAGADIYFGYTKMVMDQKHESMGYNGLIYENLDKYELEIKAFGLKPLMGYKYFLTPQISLAIEGSIRSDLREGTGKYTEKNGLDPTEKNTDNYSGYYTGISPCGRIIAGFSW
jgi:hypothetical protein